MSDFCHNYSKYARFEDSVLRAHIAHSTRGGMKNCFFGFSAAAEILVCEAELSAVGMPEEKTKTFLSIIIGNLVIVAIMSL